MRPKCMSLLKKKLFQQDIVFKITHHLTNTMHLSLKTFTVIFFVCFFHR